MDSDDLSFESELYERRRATAAIEMDSSVDIDASYPPPERRGGHPARGGSGGGGWSAGGSAGGHYRSKSSGNPYATTSYSRNPRDRFDTSTPSLDSSEAEQSVSVSLDDTSAYANAMRSLSRKPSAISSGGYGSRPQLGRSATMAAPSSASLSSSQRVRRTYDDSSLDDLDPDNDTDYVPTFRQPETTAYQAMLQRSSSVPHRSVSPPSPPPAQRQAASRGRAKDEDEEEEEVSISFEEEEEDTDVRASNNTLIKKAQQIQAEETERERARIVQEQKEKEDQRQAKLDADKKKRDAVAADAKRAAAERRRREQEEEEEERDRLEAERVAAELRAAAEIEDEYEEDEFAAAPPSTSAKTGLDALDATTDSDEDAEIERARQLLEAEQEREEEEERRRDQVAAASGKKPQSSSNLDDLSFGDSAELELARRRQEAEEEEQAEEEARKRRAQQQLAQQQHARRASLEAAVEESYEGEFDTPPLTKTNSRDKRTHQSSNNSSARTSHSSTPVHMAVPAPSAAAVPHLNSTDAAAPSVFAAALASLDPQVAALVMKAVADQMVTGGPSTSPVSAQPPSVVTPAVGMQYSVYNPQPSHPRPSPVFDPSQSRAAAADAWERLLAMRSTPGRASGAVGPSPSLPQPPAASTQVNSWEGVLAAVSASHLARSDVPAVAAANKLFARQPTAFSGSAEARYSAQPPYPSTSAGYDVRDFNRDGSMNRYINQVLHSGLAEDHSRTHLRVETERDALRRLLTFNPYTAGGSESTATTQDGGGPSAALSGRVRDQKNLYLQDQAILNSVLRRVLTKGETTQAKAELESKTALELQASSSTSKRPTHERRVSEGVKDDGRPLPANDVIKMLEEGYPFAAHDAWQHFSTNTLARTVLLAAEPASQRFTRHVVESTLKETLSEMLADQKVVDSIKKAALKKLKHRLAFDATREAQNDAPDTSSRPERAQTIRR